MLEKAEFAIALLLLWKYMPQEWIMRNPNNLFWIYELTKQGFVVSIECQVGDKRVKISHTMSWTDFMHGLTLGWKQYHQTNEEFTHLIAAFIREQQRKKQ